MSEEVDVTICILETYHQKGGTYVIPVEVINDVEDLLEEQQQEIERLNNIIGEATDRAIQIQKTFGYVLDDLIYLLMQGSDKE